MGHTRAVVIKSKRQEHMTPRRVRSNDVAQSGGAVLGMLKKACLKNNFRDIGRKA